MATHTRRPIHAYVTETAHDAWHNYAAEEGISVSALLQIIAPKLDDTITQRMISDARGLDTARRRRKP